MRSHEGRLAVVTGAARGIGQAIAVGLAGRGSRVAVFDVEDAAGTVEQIEAARGDVLAVAVDLTDAPSVVQAVGAVRQRFGAIDIVVNNAAVSNSIPFLEVTPAEWRRVMSANLDAPFLLLREVVPDMVAKGWGRIVNVASSSMYTTARDKATYISSKAGLLGLTLALANDLGQFGITANAVSPGLTMTPMLEAQVRDGRVSAEAVESIWQHQAIPRRTSVSDVVGPALFLTSDDAAMVTGQFLTADGGITHHL